MRTKDREGKASSDSTSMHMHAPSQDADFGLQTRQCVVYWSHGYTMASWGSGGLPPETFS